MPDLALRQVANTIAAAHPDKPRPAPPVTALARLRNDVAVVPTQTGSQLVTNPALPHSCARRLMQGSAY